MNDPMEAFYEQGGPGDWVADAAFKAAGKDIGELRKLLDEMIQNCALVSFTGTVDALPLWAYYAGNFTGICLEFDPSKLSRGEFKGERLLPVTYARNALPAISFSDMASDRKEEIVLSRLSRKRIEWSHESEWRFVVGARGPKHYVDDALVRVYLGPSILADHEREICRLLARRPTEILKGRPKGFDLVFDLIQPATPLSECERVGGAKANQQDDLLAEKDLRSFLSVSYDKLLEEYQRTVEHPNFHEFVGIDVSVNEKDRIYIRTVLRLRNGRDVYWKRYFDSHMRLVGET